MSFMPNWNLFGSQKPTYLELQQQRSRQIEQFKLYFGGYVQWTIIRVSESFHTETQCRSNKFLACSAVLDDLALIFCFLSFRKKLSNLLCVIYHIVRLINFTVLRLYIEFTKCKRIPSTSQKATLMESCLVCLCEYLWLLQSRVWLWIGQLSVLMTSIFECMEFISYSKLPPSFPQEAPEVRLSPTARHPWLNDSGLVTGCPGLHGVSNIGAYNVMRMQNNRLARE